MKLSWTAAPLALLGAISLTACPADYVPSNGTWEYKTRVVTADTCKIPELLSDVAPHFVVTADGDGEELWVPSNGVDVYECDAGKGVFTCERESPSSVQFKGDSFEDAIGVQMKSTITVQPSEANVGAIGGDEHVTVDCIGDRCAHFTTAHGTRFPCEHTVHFTAELTKL